MLGYGQPGEGPPRRPTVVTALVAALLGFVAAFASGYIPVDLFLDIPSGFSLGDLPRWTLIDLGAFLVAALFLLVGALAVLFRAVAGAFLLLIGSLLAIAGLLIEATQTYGLPVSSYFEKIFAFGTFAADDRAIVLFTTPLILVFSVLPPTFRYLRYRTPVRQAYPRQW